MTSSGSFLDRVFPVPRGAKRGSLKRTFMVAVFFAVAGTISLVMGGTSHRFDIPMWAIGVVMLLGSAYTFGLWLRHRAVIPKD
ncbi:hypothetical protein MN032_05400 [Agromyces atrinae]|uniref:hypothetical protein n=1 Tax=Agromyces atrinae TaxID=592376 RepID=UPI001F576B3D|nr:hypothetical protein [Agromyces atrinae]MCI2957121.1 hypothetical protein [Agromyces atrinae]